MYDGPVNVGLRGACAALSYLYLLLLVSLPATARAEARLRVVGSVVIEASASRSANGSELQARLIDDSGRAVPGAALEIRPLSASAPTARECRSRGSLLTANAAGLFVVCTNGSGSLCVRFEGAGESAEFELAYRDTGGLYAPVSRRVIADSAIRNVEMAFAPAPTVLALERDTQLLVLATRPSPPLFAGEAVESLAIGLSMARDGRPSQPLATTHVEIGSSAEFRIPSRSLGMPGPLELSAEFPGSTSTRAGRSVAHVIATATVALPLAEPIAAGHPESGLHVHVRASSVVGNVPSGAIEARSGAQVVGSARVNEGGAELFVQLEEAAAKAQPLELRYVPDSPFWLPGAALSLDLPSPWRLIGLIAAAAALGSWLLLGWQRPRRIERSTVLGPMPAVRAPIDILEVGDARSGWRGQVVDAHDGTPIAGASVLVRLPSFDASGVLRTAHSDASGAFVLEGVDSAGPGAALEVRAPLHTPLAAPMPPPGVLVLSMTSRRRSLMARFVEWAARDGGWDRRGEATPGEVARRSDRSEVASWASAVDEAAFGAEPLTEAKEQAIVGHEPAHNRKQPLKVDRV